MKNLQLKPGPAEVNSLKPLRANPKRMRRRLFAGAAATASLAVLARPEWAQIIQFVAIVSIVPLGLTLIQRRHQSTWFENLAWCLSPAAAAVAWVGYFFEPGLPAAVLAAPWFGITLLIALGGLVRLVDRPWPLDHRFMETAAQGFLLVGGSWFLLARADLNPMGFSDAIVALTGIHFHYAGFAMPLVVAQLGYREPSKAVNIATLGVLIGIPLTAFGLTVGGVFELIGGTTMASAGLWVAVLLLRRARKEPGWTGFSLGFAAICLMFGMVLAALYVLGIQFEQGWLSIELMVRTHGSLNGFGFGLVAILTFAFSDLAAPPSTKARLTPKRVSAGAAKVTIDQWIDSSSNVTYPEGIARLAEPPSGYRLDTWSRPLGEGPAAFEAASAAIRSWVGHRDGAGFAVTPDQPKLEAGSDVVVAIPLGPLTFYAPSRIIWTVDETRQFGFAYGTLDGHFSSGEESFIVHFHDSGSVDVEIRAVWRPAWWPLRLGGPVTRYVQGRSIRHWLDGLERYCADPRRVEVSRNGLNET